MIKIIHTKISNLNNYIIQNHPASGNFKSNIKLINEMQQIIDSKSSTKKDLYDYIFIGNTGVISVYLEKGYKMIHICEQPEFESYQGKIWKNIKTKKISKNLFSYKLKKKGSLIKFGRKNTDLNSILNY